MTDLPDTVTTPGDAGDFLSEHEEEWRDAIKLIAEEAETWRRIPESEWSKVDDQCDCTTSTRTYGDSSYAMLRSTGKIQTERTAEEFLDFLFELQMNPKLRPMFVECEATNVYYYLVHRFAPDFILTHVRQTPNSYVVYDRDLLSLRQKFVTDENNCSIISVSPDNAETTESVYNAVLPSDSKCVRGYFRFAGFARKIENELIYTIYLHVDPAGWVPSAAYNYTMYSKGHSVGKQLKMFKELEGENLALVNEVVAAAKGE